MSRVVLDVSMSLDGLIAGPNVREAEPMGDAANAYTHGWPGMGPTPRSTSACAEKWTRPLAPRSSGGARYMITSHATPLSGLRTWRGGRAGKQQSYRPRSLLHRQRQPEEGRLAGRGLGWRLRVFPRAQGVLR